MIELARELGLALAGSDEFQRMRRAQTAFEASEAIVSLMSELSEKRGALVAALAEEPADNLLAVQLTDDVERLEEQLQDSPLYTELSEAETAFSQVLQAVNDEINACIGVSEKSRCSGNCSACGGCAH